MPLKSNYIINNENICLNIPVNLYKNTFIIDYKAFIENQVFIKLNGELSGIDYQILVKSWVGTFYIIAADIEEKLVLAVGNTKEGIKIHQLKLWINFSDLNQKDYKIFSIPEFKKALKEEFYILKKRGLIYTGKDTKSTTTLQRLIWVIGSNVKIGPEIDPKDKKRGLEVHHIDCNSLNNRFDNLLPLDKGFHDKLHIAYNSGKITHERYMAIIEEKRKKLKERKSHYSKYNDDFLHFVICLCYYILNLHPDKISKFTYNKRKTPCPRTIWHIIALYPCFKDYYLEIDYNSKKLCINNFSSDFCTLT